MLVFLFLLGAFHAAIVVIFCTQRDNFYLVIRADSVYTRAARTLRVVSMFPTNLAMRLARDCGLHKHVQTELHLDEAMADFQKVSAIDTFDSAMIIFNAHVVKESITDVQIGVLERIFAFTKIEVNGQIVNSITKVMNDSGIETNRLIAAKLIHGIQNGEGGGVNSKEVKKIIFELAGAE